MRTILLLSVIATLAACSDEQQPTTAPRSTAAAPVASAQATATGPEASAKGGQAAGGLNTIIVTSHEITNQGYAVAGQAMCPDGTKLLSGGYMYINEGNPSAPMVVTQNYPFGNGWRVRTLNAIPGSWPASYKVYAVCAS